MERTPTGDEPPWARATHPLSVPAQAPDLARFSRNALGHRFSVGPSALTVFFKADPADHDQLEAVKQDVIAFLIGKVQSNDLLILKDSNPLGLQTILEKF